MSLREWGKYEVGADGDGRLVSIWQEGGVASRPLLLLRACEGQGCKGRAAIRAREGEGASRTAAQPDPSRSIRL